MRIAGAVAALLAALTLAPAAAGQGTLPPYGGLYEPQGVDERGVWMEADERERKLRDSKFVIQDGALNEYVRSVLCRTVGDDRCKGVRIYVIRSAVTNMSMEANGTMRVMTGFLLRMRDEAELASILGHEFAHFELRHTLVGFRQRRSASDIMQWMSLFGYNGAMVADAALISVFTFSRAQERAADLLSMQYLKASRYDPHRFSAVWDRLMDEADATAAGRKQRSSRYDRVALFSTHPTDLERATYLREAAATITEPRDAGAKPYGDALANWRAEFLADQLKLNDFAGTEYLLAELGKDGWTPDLLFARAELYRTRGNPRDLEAAAGFYRAVLSATPAHAEAHRGLGLALMRSRQAEEGGAALKQYLTLRPTAPDASMIASLIAP